ncbi:MAG: DUF1565 domain-containing protein [Planctomycetota bacterium]|nr:DUF1565 domain-containing protein [Planctomycetota bacterium]
MHKLLHSANSPASGTLSTGAKIRSRLERWLVRARRAGLAAAVCGLSFASSTIMAEDGPGIQARIGHIEGQGIPQVLPVTPLELFPYYESDGTLMFSDLRWVITNDGTFGGNVGFGYRFFEPETDRIYGGSFWYDIDDTRQLLFQQVGLSFESYGTNFDVRGNVYLPVGPESRQDSLTLINGSLQFQNQNLVYSQSRSWYTAMKGLDGEIGIPVPGNIAESIDLRIYGGGYFYQNSYHDIPGISTRLQANLFPGLDATVQVTYDSFFETRAFAGISWTFGPLHYSNFDRGDTMGRIGEHVTRNYTVVATHQRQTETVVATNPVTKQPYRFAHVNSFAAPDGTGGVNNPFATIADAQATHPDVVFVHAGSVFSGANAQIVMYNGERLLGDGNGIQHIFQVPELGPVFAPHGPTSGALPILQNASGAAVTLASHTELNGFSIVNPAGRGVVGNGVAQALVRNVSISGSSSHGFELFNTAGDVQLDNLFVTGTTGSGVRVSGTGGTTRFGFECDVRQPAGREAVRPRV